MTTESKARFFGLYWGQKVYRLDGLSNLKSKPFETPMEGDHLELTSLADITDEDAIEVANIVKSFYPKEEQFSIPEVKSFLVDWLTDVEFVVLALSVCDLLRSHGYALPFMGWTVEEMVKAGWIKLKKK